MSSTSDFTSGGGGFAVQSGREEVALNNSSAEEYTDVTISAVDTSKSFIVVAVSGNNADISRYVGGSAYFPTTGASVTSFRLTYNDSITAGVNFDWFVVTSN